MRSTALVLVVSMLAFGSREVFARQTEAGAWRDVAQTIPLGARVKVQMTDGRRISGTLMRVDGDAIMLKRNTRRPEPARAVAFADMSRLERDKGGNGTNVAKAVGAGLAVGVGVFVSMILIALQLD